MKDRPILFSAPMVRAILAGRKTITRRIVRLPSEPAWMLGSHDRGTAIFCQVGSPAVGVEARSPYGGPGDRLWVRETFCACRHREKHPNCVHYRADADDPDLRWTPSIFMTRALSRITLGISSLRVERLQAITEQDAIAEGVDNVGFPRETFAALWDTINGKRGPWASNPWVWCVEFQKVGPTSEPVRGGPPDRIVGWTR